MKVELVYRIRSRKTGLYSTGTSTPNWNKTGKIWRTKSALGNHLALGHQYNQVLQSIYAREDAEIVTCQLTEVELECRPVVFKEKGSK
jgi:hypothetical protein